jgi:predicted Zn-dependent protease
MVAILVGCAVNPATGKRQIALIGEQREIQIGQESHVQVEAAYGFYDDAELQEYIQGIGDRLAAQSERPHLDWSFRVVDDASVNAFALPGGFIYVTRGILAHLDSEAELAGVIGHEIGHVTARHGVNRMSKAQLANLGLGIGSIVSPKFGRYSDLAGTGVELLLLKNSRDDERQADDLGVRYMARSQYDPDPMADVFETLRRVSERGGGRMPGWLSTHPAPENRKARIGEQIALHAGVPGERRVGRSEFLERIDGVVFGDDPRQGYFKGIAFYHPGMRFRLEFPDGWKTSNQRTAVTALNEEQDAMVQLTVAPQDSPRAAAEKFFEPEGVTTGAVLADSIHGLPAVAWTFGAASGETPLQGAVAFVKLGDRVFRMVGVTSKDRWSTHEKTLISAVRSFRELEDPAALAVKPARVAVVTLKSAMTLEEAGKRYGSTAEPDVLALVNRLEPGDRLRAGTRIKIVQGGKVP